MSTHLGPLERHPDGHWLLGNPEGKKGGAHFVLEREGLRHRVEGTEEKLLPWARQMELSVRPKTHPWGTWQLRGLLRTPYEQWQAPFAHHTRRRYQQGHVLILNELLRQLTAAHALDRLADPEWLQHVVTPLAPEDPLSPRSAQLLVQQVLRTAGGLVLPEQPRRDLITEPSTPYFP
ncbi:hypothetical protein GCM10010218_54540 [Streptomyces mashuensis]|uniref:Uncharacterized protein n=1 Tax=Streptomyces mashuensis TaxID=33904 RepID=A0A919B8D4_9ACTN|nr:hypothetical protein [Streptomyces mashuensis]GHF66148.1 hypothetical protein GCM10010218_54540 [Streptomyces mashuensis]